MGGKYKARKTTVDGITFDSKKESLRYQELKLLKAAGEIENFELQPKYILQPKFEKKGIKYRPITYKADFKIYHLDGSVTVEDVKGFKTKEFLLKQKMFEYQNPGLSLKLL